MRAKSLLCVMALALAASACDEKPPEPTPATNAAPPEKPATNTAAPETNNAETTGAAEAPTTAAQGTNLAEIDPTTLKEQAPDEFKVKFDTTAGEFTVDVVREWSPNGADRFYNLVKAGYYTDIGVFRVIDGFMAQFGIHGDPAVNTRWQEATITDDPSKKGISNTEGYLTYAMRGPHTRTVQLFINHGNNSSLDRQGFTPIGKVAGDGMQIVRKWYGGYGEGAPNGKGPNQMLVQTQGNEYLKRDFPELSYIKAITLVDGAEGAAAPDKPDAKPPVKKAWEAGTFVHPDISESMVEGGEVKLNLKDDGSVLGNFQGKREGKGFSIPLKGDINDQGMIKATGSRGPNEITLTGRFNEGGVFGSMQGTVHGKPVRIALKAKK